MEKLSSILPSNSRITSVDLETGSPVRPGAPAFGRKVGQNTIKDKVTLSNQAKELALQESALVGRKNPKEVAQAKMVEDLSRKFFETRLQKPVIEEKKMDSEPQSEAVNEQMADMDLSSVREQIAQYESQQPQAEVVSQVDIEA